MVFLDSEAVLVCSVLLGLGIQERLPGWTPNVNVGHRSSDKCPGTVLHAFFTSCNLLVYLECLAMVSSADEASFKFVHPGSVACFLQHCQRKCSVIHNVNEIVLSR